MKSNTKIQYTVRNVPPEIDRVLRKKAKEEKCSLNQLLVQALQKEAGMTEAIEHHDFDFLIGSWISDPEVDHYFENDLRKIDKDLWK